MKICLVTEHFYPGNDGGVPTMLANLLRYLADHYDDLDIDVLCSNNCYRQPGLKLPCFQDWDSIRIRRIHCPCVKRGSKRRRLIQGAYFSIAAGLDLTLRPKYDVILVGSSPPSAPLAASMVSRARRVPYVYIIHDLFPDIMLRLQASRAEGSVYRIARRFQGSWLRGAEKVIVLGRCMRDYIGKTYEVPAGKIEVITSWADPSFIYPLHKQTPTRTAHGLTGFVVLYAGNFGVVQDFDTMLDAAKVLQAKSEPITFVLVGDGAKRPYVAQRVAELALDNVKLLPFVPSEELPSLLSTADVSVVSLEPGMEGLGVPSKFYNVLASGRPTLALMGPDSEVARVISEHGCGVRVDHGDPHGFAEELLALARAPGKLEEMGNTARRLCLEYYSTAKIADEYYAVFKEAMGRDS